MPFVQGGTQAFNNATQTGLGNLANTGLRSRGFSRTGKTVQQAHDEMRGLAGSLVNPNAAKMYAPPNAAQIGMSQLGGHSNNVPIDVMSAQGKAEQANVYTDPNSEQYKNNGVMPGQVPTMNAVQQARGIGGSVVPPGGGVSWDGPAQGQNTLDPRNAALNVYRT